MTEQVLAGRVPSSRRISTQGVLLVASLGAGLAFLDTSIVNIAFPSIQQAFPHTTLTTLSWILTAYNIVIAALLVPAGRLTDVLGRRRTFNTGIVVFALASVVSIR